MASDETEDLRPAVDLLLGKIDELVGHISNPIAKATTESERLEFDSWWESEGPNTASIYEAAWSAWKAAKARP